MSGDYIRWIKITILLTGLLCSLLACSKTIEQNNNSENLQIPEGYQLVVSTHGSYQYFLPEDWEKKEFNYYKGTTGSVLEQIYPSAEITDEYCSSFVFVAGSNQVVNEIEKHIYNNGQIDGCFIIRDMLNTELNKEWRHTSFSFETSRGVEDVMIVMEKPNYDEDKILTIINSIRIK